MLILFPFFQANFWWKRSGINTFNDALYFLI